MTDFYRGIRGNGAGVNYSPNSKGKNLWRSPEDAKRIEINNTLQNLYDGRHCTMDGGPFPHPYTEIKAREESIRYVQTNLLAKCSRCYADLIAGEEPVFSSDIPRVKEILDSIDFGLPLWASLVQSSKFGFVGLCPCVNKEKRGRGNDYQSDWSWNTVDSDYLSLEFSELDKSLLSIQKNIVLPKVNTLSGIIDILFKETHYQDRIETSLFQVEGESLLKSLPIEWFQYFSESETPPETWVHNLGRFFISLIFNEKIGTRIYGDYSLTAIKLQETLNSRMTQIDRILYRHADPKLIAPLSSARKDEESGRHFFNYDGKEVLFYDDKTQTNEPFQLMTWNGELTQAVANRNDTISAILTEFDLSPQLLSFTDLVGGTVAETAEKMKMMMHSTIKRALRKRKFMEKALYDLCDNILALQGFQNADYSISFPELIPETIMEKIEKQVLRKQVGLQTTREAIKILDNLTDEDADQKTEEIFNEQANAVNNPFSDTQDNIFQSLDIDRSPVFPEKETFTESV